MISLELNHVRKEWVKRCAGFKQGQVNKEWINGQRDQSVLRKEEDRKVCIWLRDHMMHWQLIFKLLYRICLDLHLIYIWCRLFQQDKKEVEASLTLGLTLRGIQIFQVFHVSYYFYWDYVLFLSCFIHS